jgi:hypothetical protein
MLFSYANVGSCIRHPHSSSYTMKMSFEAKNIQEPKCRIGEEVQHALQDSPRIPRLSASEAVTAGCDFL